MVTTIQLNENVKKALDRLKTGKQSYEEIILQLMRMVEKYKRSQKELLRQGYKEMALENLAMTKEWEVADKEWD